MLILDTNAWYAFLMYFLVYRAGGPPVWVHRRNRDAVVAEVQTAIESEELAIPFTVANETLRGMKNAFESAAKSAKGRAEAGAKAAAGARARFKRLYAAHGIDDEKGRLQEIGRMYAGAPHDPRMGGAVALWRSVKERHGRGAAFPALETHLADFVILSTAAGQVAQGNAARLLTFDHDLVAFADAIRERFGVVIVDGGSLRPR